MQMQDGHDHPAFAYSTLAMFLLMFVGLLIFLGIFSNICYFFLFSIIFAQET